MSDPDADAPAGAVRLIPAAYRPLLRHPVLRRLLPGLMVSGLGDGMSAVAVAWLAIELVPGNSGALVAASVAAFTFPGVVTGLMLGRLLGHLDGRLLLLLNSALRAVALGAIPVFAAAGALTPVWYVSLLGVSSLLHPWGVSGKYALVAELLPAGQWLAGNSLLSGIDSVALIAGPGVASAVIAVSGPAAAIGVDAASYAVLGVALYRTRRSLPARLVGTRGRSFEGMRALAGTRVLVGLLSLSFLFTLLYGPVEVALPVHIGDDLHQPAAVLGLFWTLFGVGAVVGAMAAGVVSKGLPLWPSALAIVAGWGLALLPLAFTTAYIPGLVGFAVGGLIFAPYPALARTIMQDHSPPHLLAGIGAAWTAVMGIAQPAGLAVGGPLVLAFGAQQALRLSALATILLALVAAAILLAGRARVPGRVGVDNLSDAG